MRKKQIGIILIVILLLLLGCGCTASAGFRRMANGKYRYYTSKTTYLSGKKSAKAADPCRWTFKNIRTNGNEYTYCFDENGYMQTGWKKLYTSQKNGVTGWFYYYFGTNGRMYKNCSREGRYLQANGRMLTNAYGPDGGYRGANGKLSTEHSKEGFVVTKKGTQYLKEDGSMVIKSWVCAKDPIDGKYYWYYFYSTGYMAVNKVLGNYYVDANGRKR